MQQKPPILTILRKNLNEKLSHAIAAEGYHGRGTLQFSVEIEQQDAWKLSPSKSNRPDFKSRFLASNCTDIP
jgi:hypothetical protein